MGTNELHNPFSPGNDLTEIQAFFLGSLLSENQQVEGSDGYRWLVNYRHNKGVATADQIAEHKAVVSKLASHVGAAVKDIQGRFDGFTVVVTFPASVTSDDLLDAAGWIKDYGGIETKKAFLSGFFDGKSSYDLAESNPKVQGCQLVVDCPDADSDRIFTLVCDMFGDLGIHPGVNDKRARLEGGRDRHYQIRLRKNDRETFVKKIGFASSYKLYRARKLYEDCPYLNERSSNLPGVKVISPVQIENFHSRIIPLAELDSDLIARETSLDLLQGEQASRFVQVPKSRVWSKEPREKPPAKTKGKNNTPCYDRNLQIAKDALSYSGFKCEIDTSHHTFLRASDGTPYTEPHHLIPMAYQDAFDYSLDVVENIVSLCSICHDEIHYGKERERLIKVLYDIRAPHLHRMKIGVTFDELRAMYNL